ncbi:hypothetical protein RRG08_020726 [Elysia crispata]|uniref:Uncharacterized protein n=1 Tax=Elysia crispata TaxID=231223 RepID=A0AAE0Z6Q5_9GAST|nr:hypothetical protein RRG08_020726 [Elysia crispata]
MSPRLQALKLASRGCTGSDITIVNMAPPSVSKTTSSQACVKGLYGFGYHHCKHGSSKCLQDYKLAIRWFCSPALTVGQRESVS